MIAVAGEGPASASAIERHGRKPAHEQALSRAQELFVELIKLLLQPHGGIPFCLVDASRLAQGTTPVGGVVVCAF
jgi:hypothetical protein